MTANDTKIVIRLPHAEKRYIRSLAAREGLTLREALHQAFQAWEAQMQAPTRPAAPAAEGQPQDRKATSSAWLRQAAAQLDWSKCPEAQRVAGKDGNVWVVRGTRVPVSAVLDALAEGYPPGEVAEVFEFSLPRLLAILRFAVESAPPGTSGR